MKILASTSRLWNTGDDFILMGLKNLFPSDTMWTIYNRNPDTNSVVGNEWNLNKKIDIFDKVVIAGTPQWYGPSMKRLFEAIKENPKPVYFYGIGIGEAGLGELSPLDIETLKNAKVVITRGENCAKLLREKGISATANTCPALFAYPEEKFYYGLNEDKFGCVMVCDWGWKKYQPEIIDKQMSLFKKLGGEIIVHHADELQFACKHFEKVHYSYDPRDYEEIYSQFGSIISMRLHGAIYGLSHLKPTFLIDTKSIRCQDVVGQIPCLIHCEPEEVHDKIQDFDFAKKYYEIRKFKQQKRAEYKEYL